MYMFIDWNYSDSIRQWQMPKPSSLCQEREFFTFAFCIIFIIHIYFDASTKKCISDHLLSVYCNIKQKVRFVQTFVFLHYNQIIIINVYFCIECFALIQFKSCAHLFAILILSPRSISFHMSVFTLALSLHFCQLTLNNKNYFVHLFAIGIELVLYHP